MSTPSSDGFGGISSSEALKQSLIASILGASGLVARQLLSNDKPSWGYLIRSCAAAMITAYFVNEGAKEYITSESLRVCTCGVAGFASPEILSYGIKFIEAKLKAKVAAVSPKPRKGKHGKRK